MSLYTPRLRSVKLPPPNFVRSLGLSLNEFYFAPILKRGLNQQSIATQSNNLHIKNPTTLTLDFVIDIMQKHLHILVSKYRTCKFVGQDV